MKILFISSWYPTKNNPNFGIFVKEHAHSIKLSGHDIVVVALILNKTNHPFQIKHSEFNDNHGVRTFILEINSALKDWIYYNEYLQYLLVKKTVDRLIHSGFKPDIIHSNVVYPTGIFGSRLSKKWRIPHIITEHWSRVENAIKLPFLSTKIISAYMNSNRILPVSCFLKNKISALIPKLENSKFDTIGNVVDSQLFFYKEKKIQPECLKFCAIATWANKRVPDKLPELFIEALSEFQKKTKSSISLTMIGGGDKLGELKQLCEIKNLKTDFTGYLTKTEIVEYLQNSDFFIHASTIETFGIVTAEALMCGTPVICSDTGALPELINDTNGILCENNAENWITGLEKLTTRKFNHLLISEEINKKFDMRSIGNKISSVYDSVKQ